MYGTDNGQLGALALDATNAKRGWTMANDKKKGGVQVVTQVDITHSGVPEMVVGRDDGYGTRTAAAPRDGLAGVAGVQVIPNKLRLASEESAIVEVQLRANKLPPPKSGASTFARSLACACVRAASASLTPLSSCSWS